ncbi:MAG: hypothetical protein HY721_02205 [Planctomycetes bacterium]|nr:hypothetical protein [Planctomycetota bacterium]
MACSGTERSLCRELARPISDAIEVATPGPIAAFHRGDADQNGQLQLTDAVQVLGYLFLGKPGRVPQCLDAADADDSGTLAITDAVRILDYLFRGIGAIGSPGPPPAACGEDPTPDGIDCERFDACTEGNG